MHWSRKGERKTPNEEAAGLAKAANSARTGAGGLVGNLFQVAASGLSELSLRIQEAWGYPCLYRDIPV